MKKALPILLVIAVVAVGLFFVFSKSNPAAGLNLEIKFKPGQIDKYKMTMDMTMNTPGSTGASSPAMQANVSLLMTMETISVNPDGSAKVKYKMSDMKMTMPGTPMAGSQAMPEAEFTATMSKDGKTSNVEGPKNMPGMAVSGMDAEQMMSNFSGVMLPGKSVKVGETWKGKMPALGGNMITQFKLDSDNQPIGNTKATKITSTFNYKGSLADLMKQSGKASSLPPGMNGNVDMSGTGTTYFDRDAGKMISADTDVVEKMDIQSPAGMGAPAGQKSMQMNMTMKMHVEKVN